MSDEPGRYKFVDQAAEAKPSVWRRTLGWIREKILHSLGRPVRLERAITSVLLIFYPIIAPVDTLWTWSVVYWQNWMFSSLSSFHSRPWTIDYRKQSYPRRPEIHSLGVPEVQHLISKENVPHKISSI